jgi:RimJ/RimL family protein N-acetyltransferase
MDRTRADRDAEKNIFTTPRLWLPALDPVQAEAILGLRPPIRAWAQGYPTEGDQAIARIVAVDPAQPSERVFGPRVMVLRATGEAIGGIGFFGPPVDGTLAVGYSLAELHRGQGLVSEALRALLRFADGRAEVHEVYADTDPDNLASQHVLAACGFVRYPDREDGLRVFRRSSQTGGAPSLSL